MKSNVDCNNNSQTASGLNIVGSESIRSEVFPSLPDVMLRKLCLLRENTCNIESLSEQEIDAKFHTLSLAFKTDKFTLEQRVQLYRHQRDVAENDAQTELNHLNEYVQELYRLLLGSESKYFYNTSLMQLKELKDMLDKIDMQAQVIKASMMKISSRSELYGSVKQEEKLSSAFDVILLHTENLKRAKERDAKELEDMKRLLATTGHSKQDQDHDDLNIANFHNGRRTRNRDSRRISSLLMANQLQNIQVSYQQTSRGSGSSNQNYMRTRRLSVPAAEIRNRPRLLELFNEATARQLREKDDESDDDYDDDEQINMAKQRQIPLRQRQRTLASIDDHKESASDNDDDDNEQMDSLKQESKSSDKIDGNDQLQATTTTNSCDDDNSDQKDDVSDNNSSTRDNYLINDRQQQS
ncbi:lymphoid-retiricted membrane protein, jaw1-like protein, partial [Euroglyphus maynei]